MKSNPVDRKQRKRAGASALMLAAMAIGIYLVVMMKFFVYK